MKNKHIIFVIVGLSIVVLASQLMSCKKYLDEKPDKKLVTPTSLKDVQGILDYFDYMNIQYSEAGEIASDNYYLTDIDYTGLPADRMRNAYLWKPGIFVGMSPTDWNNEYTVVYNANVVLENIEKIERNSLNASSWDNCKGSALVFRAKSFFEIAQIWAEAYDSATASTQIGIPLRLTSDFNVLSVRASMKDTYNQIIADLQSAIPLLSLTAVHNYRPSKPAAYGFLARTYLSMRKYDSAFKYSNLCLQLKSGLVDYNTLNAGASYPFSPIVFTNPEVIMHTAAVPTNYNLYFGYGSKVDTTLYRSYDPNDLRKKIFFEPNSDGSVYFAGSYDGDYTNFNGIATDEMYLTRAECYARLGNVSAAISDLNTLMIKRWNSSVTFVPFTASTSTDALNKILVERRKELLNRMLRFTDIKRLNKEGAGIILKRVVQGQTYTLSPNDAKYALPIPDDVIQLSGIQQNPGW